jgi:hypothetical protein
MEQPLLSTPSDSVDFEGEGRQHFASNWVPTRPNPSEPNSESESHTPSELHL